MANIVPYINFAKNGQEAITFYKGVFGGDAEVQFEGEHVIHLDFQADGIHFMGSDLQSDQTGLERGNGYSLVLNCDSEEQLRDFYAKLVDGGKEVFAPTDSGWGAIIAHCTDQFGVTDELRQAAELAVGDVTRMSDPWPIGALPSEKVRCTIELGKRPKNRMTQIFAHGISGNSQRDGNLLNRFALCS